MWQVRADKWAHPGDGPVTQALLRRPGLELGGIHHNGHSQIYRAMQADNKKLQLGDLIAIKVEVF